MDYFRLTFYLFIGVSAVYGSPLRKCGYQDPAIERFRIYIQIDTSKQENLYRAVEFWRKQAEELELPFKVLTPGGLPICVISVPGSDPSLPSIMLNSHMDVVPAVESEWTYPPYSAYVDDNGDIYGRGTQDAKDVSSQYMEAVRRLKQDNVVLKRTLHLTLMPDEETGGYNGIKPFVKTETFKSMNVGFILDEGIGTTDDTLLAGYQDKRPWQMKVTVHSQGGHGSNIIEDSAMEKARRFINAVSTYREQLKTQMNSVGARDYGAYSTVNINIMTGGYRPNVIPTEFSMVVDMRLSTLSDPIEVERLVESWIAEAGNGTELTFLRRDELSSATVLNESNTYWVAMKDAITEMGYQIEPIVLPATSDMLVTRNLGFPAVGFSPKTRTVSAIHAKDEYLNIDTFMKGIDIYYKVLSRLGSLPM